MRYNVHAGHNPAGMVACGAAGLLNESLENRLIKDELIKLLTAAGHTVYDCTVDNGTGQRDVLEKIAGKCNAHDVDFDFSIHLNSGRNDYSGDGKTGGFEVYVTDTGKGKGEVAARICAAMEAAGFKNRGVKITNNLYILNHTKAPALLLEVCFVDDKDDYNLYKMLGYKKIAEIIAGAITGNTVTPSAPTPDPSPTPEPIPAKKSVAEVAAEIVGGKGGWGNNPERAKKLEAAGYDPKVVQEKVNEIINGSAKSGVAYYKKYTGKSGSLVDALAAVGADSSFSNRKKIAKANGIKDYTGTASQNTKLLNLLKKGKLQKQ